MSTKKLKKKIRKMAAADLDLDVLPEQTDGPSGGGVVPPTEDIPEVSSDDLDSDDSSSDDDDSSDEKSDDDESDGKPKKATMGKRKLPRR